MDSELGTTQKLARNIGEINVIFSNLRLIELSNDSPYVVIEIKEFVREGLRV